MIAGVLLAAGRSTRFGADKLMQPLGEGTVAEAAGRALMAGVDRGVAVIRPGAGRLAGRLRALGLEPVTCIEAAHGMGHSLARGVAATADADGWAILLADMPFVRAASIQAVSSRLREGAGIAVPTCDGDRGHPVGFSARFKDELLRLQGDRGASEILRAHASVVETVEVGDPGVLCDVDTPTALAEAVARFRR